MKSLSMLLAALPALAVAAPRLSEVNGRVHVEVPGVGAAVGTAHARADHLEIEVERVAAAARVEMTDATVKRVDVIGGPHPHISLKLRRGSTFAAGAVAVTTFRQQDGALVIELPREVPHVKQKPAPKPAAPIETLEPTIISAEPTPQAEPAPAVAASPPAKAEVADELPSGVAEPATARSGATNEAPSIATTPPPTPASPVPLATWIVGALALAGAAAWAWQARKRKKSAASSTGIEIVASQSLGSRARLVLLSAAGREILVSVGERGAQLIDRWPSPQKRASADGDLLRRARPALAQRIAAAGAPVEHHEAAPRAHTAPPPVRLPPDYLKPPLPKRPPPDAANDNRTIDAAPASSSELASEQPASASSSPAVAGLKRLRKSTPKPPDPDAAWAEELIAARKKSAGEV